MLCGECCFGSFFVLGVFDRVGGAEGSLLLSQFFWLCVCGVCRERYRVQVDVICAPGGRVRASGVNGPAGPAYTSLHTLLAKFRAADACALIRQLADSVLHCCRAGKSVTAHL
jgi:hypothetical protein